MSRLVVLLWGLEPLAPGEEEWAHSWEQESLSSERRVWRAGEATGPLSSLQAMLTWRRPLD